MFIILQTIIDKHTNIAVILNPNVVKSVAHSAFKMVCKTELSDCNEHIDTACYRERCTSSVAIIYDKCVLHTHSRKKGYVCFSYFTKGKSQFPRIWRIVGRTFILPANYLIRLADLSPICFPQQFTLDYGCAGLFRASAPHSHSSAS